MLNLNTGKADCLRKDQDFEHWAAQPLTDILASNPQQQSNSPNVK